MTEYATVLKIRTLLCFLSNETHVCSVTGLSKTLCQEKYKISRIITDLEKDGLVSRSSKNKPVLTEKGLKVAKDYYNKVDLSVNLLPNSGVAPSNASRDGLIWGVFNSADTCEAVEKVWNISKLKNSLSQQKNFLGRVLSQKLKDGKYVGSVVLYDKGAYAVDNLADFNKAIINSAVIVIKEGHGKIQLETREVTLINEKTSTIQPYTLEHIRYNDSGKMEASEKLGRIFTVPLDDMRFSVFGQDSQKILHGHSNMELTFRDYDGNLIEKKVLFTVIM